MLYTNVDIFREKEAKNFQKKVCEPLSFMKKWVKKNHSKLFSCHLIPNSQMALIYGEARGFRTSTANLQ
jgi:hypothetical protein